MKNLIIRCLEVNPILFFVPNKYWFNLKAKNSDISKIKRINDYEYEVFNKSTSKLKIKSYAENFKYNRNKSDID